MGKWSLKFAIRMLVENDHNSTWCDCKSITELQEGLQEAMKGYSENKESYIFYKSILESLEG